MKTPKEELCLSTAPCYFLRVVINPVKAFAALLTLCLVACILPSAFAQPSNTIVRFHFYRGATVIGDVDVEMFDQDKPVTVSNFLHYVRGGAYHNLMLNRCVPGFVIQAGALWTPSPLSSSPFRAGTTANYGPITNEYSVGPQLSNTFGTIAMARVGGDTNSASAEWFFNLGNNSTNLDNVDGGFTVFGRVVSSTNALDYFNHIPPQNILHLGGNYSDLPVLNPQHNCNVDANCPRYNELYHIKISILPIVDTKPPTITVVSPPPNATVTSSTVTFTGTATDDQMVTSVYYSLADRSFTNAPAGNTWSFSDEIPAGTNRLYITSVDGAGQRSAPVVRTLFFSHREPLHLDVVGNGTVIGATNGQLFEVGRNLTLTAKPAPGHLFARWTGDFVYDPASVNFPMFTNATLTATFVTNPFAPMKGTYSGLFYNTNFSFQPSGAITFNVTDLGKVSGKLNVAGRSLPFSGALSAYGEANISVSVAPLFGVRSNWFIVFTLDVTNRSDQVFGPVNGPGYPYLWDANTFTSALHVNRVRAGTTLNPSPYTGKYTFALSGSDTPTTQPGGYSFASATVTAAGVAKAVGTLADGTPFSASAPVTTNGLWPVYTGLYGVRGWFFGWVQYDFSNPSDDLHGAMRWRKVGPFPGKPYANGFEMFPSLFGSRYTTATSTNRVLDFTNGIVSLTGPHLLGGATNDVFLATNNTVVNLDTNKLTITLVKPTGLFSGAMTPAGQTRSIAFKGAVLPKQKYGVGFYLSTNLSGRVYFGP